MTLKQKKEFNNNMGYILRFLVGLTFISPVIIGTLFSFIPSRVLYRIPTLAEYFELFSFENYGWVWNYLPIGRYIVNTVIVCAIVIVTQVVFSSLAAYALAMYDFPCKALIFTLIQMAMMIPSEVVVLANFIQIQKWGLVDTYLGLTITGMISGTSIFLMRQSFMSQPRAIKEAAMIDGCGEARYLFSVAMPMARPSIIALAMMRFISSYNAYFWPLLVTNKEYMRTIQIGMARLIGEDIPEYGNILAGAVICMIPAIIVFIIGNNYLVKGMSEGAVKG